MTAMNCPKCGGQIPEGSTTCAACASVEAQQRRGKRMGPLVLIVVSALIVIAVVFIRGREFFQPATSATHAQPPPSPVDLADLRTKSERGDVQAQVLLGDALIEGRGARPDYKEAVKWFRLAADKGNAEAQNKLGMLFQAGQGVQQDDTEAVRLFRKAAEQGHVGAEYNLGSAYGGGRGVAQNSEEAARWYLRAAEHGDSYAQYNVAQRYELGRGVAVDPVEAYKWYELAAKQGVEDAVAARTQVKAKLSRAEIREAEQRAKNFKSKPAPASGIQ